MTMQEIIDAIDAEIKKAQHAVSEEKSSASKTWAKAVMLHIEYVNGLRFARDLVEKAEVGE